MFPSFFTFKQTKKATERRQIEEVEETFKSAADHLADQKLWFFNWWNWSDIAYEFATQKKGLKFAPTCEISLENPLL